MTVPVGVPAGYLHTEKLLQIFDALVDAPISDNNWGALKLAILDVWPRDPWAHQWDTPSQDDTPTDDTDDLSEEEAGD